MALSAYIPVDRLVALAAGRDLPDRTSGAALFADLAGSTQLAEMLLRHHGPERGVEELTALINRICGVLLDAVERYGGSAISFSGDAITCWFDGQAAGLRAAAAALDMQRAIAQIAPVRTSDSELEVALKIVIAGGPIRRFAIGDPGLGRIDVLAGGTLDLLGALEHLARRGDTLVEADLATGLGDTAALGEWRADEASAARAARLLGLRAAVPPAPWDRPAESPDLDDLARPWLLPAVAARLLGSRGATSPPLLAEIRRAVALFLSFRGIDYDNDEDAPVLLDAFIRRVQQIAAAYGGALLQLTMGDKGSYLYVAFGAPVANDNAAANAVGAAFALRELPAQLSFIGDLRIGIAQGQMYCGDYGGPTRCTYGALGDATNIAARLMTLAPPGAIRCDDRVYRAARRRWAFAELHAVRLKGKRDLVPLFTPTGPSADLERAADALAPIGRDAELARLDRLLGRLADGAGRLLIISGEPGVGKSVLGATLARRALARRVGLLQSAASSVEQQTPYHAWRDLLEGFFGLGPISDPAARRGEVRALVSALAPRLQQRVPLLNDVLHLGFADTPLTTALDARLRQESLLGLVLALLRARMAEGPLLLLIDDAQWLDQLSWQLTAGVTRALLDEGAPLLMALLCRESGLSGSSEGHLARVAALPQAETMRLGGLSADGLADLAARRLGVAAAHLPAAVVAQLRERAAGNPFFAEELIDNLRDSGLLRVEPAAHGPRCIAHPDLAAGRAPLPQSIEGLVLARIDRLPAQQQLLLKVAAVIGRSFAAQPLHATLRHYAPVDRPTLADYLDSLSRHDLTMPESIEPELTYAFKHIVTHSVAYETLLFGQRAEIHRAVASWYERSYAQQLAPFYPLLAHHYHMADDRASEARYARLAGEQAAGLYANEDAVAYLSRALRLTPPDDAAARFAVLLARERVYEVLARRESQASDVRALEAAAERLDDDRRRAIAALRRASFAERVSDYAAGARAAERAIGLAAALGDRPSEAEGRLLLGKVLQKQGAYDDARASLERAHRLLDGAAPSPLAGNILHNLGVVLLAQSDDARAGGYFQRAAALFRQLGDQRGEATATLGLNAVASYSGDYARARDLAAAALDLLRAVGDRQGEAYALSNMADDVLALGDYLAARAYLEQALKIFQAIGSWEGVGWAFNNLGEVSFALGDYARARAHFSAALAIFQAIGLAEDESGALRFLGLLAHLEGADEQALDLAGQAMAIAARIGWARGQGYALMVRGHALAGLGSVAHAEAAYAQALDLRVELAEPALLMEARAGLARMALARGDAAAALAYAEPILALLAAGDLAGADEPARVELTCYEALLAAGDPRAPAALAAAAGRLRRRAEHIGDPELRAAFLRVEAHRRLLSMP